jgi:hypothetical protein
VILQNNFLSWTMPPSRGYFWIGKGKFLLGNWSQVGAATKGLDKYFLHILFIGTLM